MRKIFVLIAFIMLAFNIFAMNEDPQMMCESSQEIKLINSLCGDNFIDMFKKLFSFLQAKDKDLIPEEFGKFAKELINKQADLLMGKEYDQILPEIIKALDFINECLKNNNEGIDKKLLATLNNVYTPKCKSLISDYLGRIPDEEMDLEFSKAVNSNQYYKARVLLSSNKINRRFKDPITEDSWIDVAANKGYKEIEMLLINTRGY